MAWWVRILHNTSAHARSCWSWKILSFFFYYFRPGRVFFLGICVGRNLWIGDIHGSACTIYGSILCAEIHGLRRYLWIAQGSCLRGPQGKFAGPVPESHFFKLIFLDSLHYMFGQLFPTYQSGAKRKCVIIVILRQVPALSACRELWRRSDADGLWFCSVDCRGPLKCVKLFNFRLVEITNPPMYVCANNTVSYAKFMNRVARSTDICAIHGFLRRVWIHRLRKQIHGYIADPQIAPNICIWLGMTFNYPVLWVRVNDQG